MAADAKPAANHESFAWRGGETEPRFKIGPVRLYAGVGADLEGGTVGWRAARRQNRIEVGAFSLSCSDGAEMVPPQAQVQREPRFRAPIVLHVDIGLPEPEILPLGIYLPLN